VDGTTTFGNATFLNQYIQNKLDVSGQTDTSGLYVKHNLDVSGNLTVDGTTTFANATFQNQYIQNKLDVSGQTDTSGLYVYNNLDVSGNINIQGNTNIQGTTNYRIQVLDVSATITDISDQPTMYVVDCGGAAPTIVLTGVTGSPLKVGVTYYFIAKNTVGNLQISYKSLDGPVTTAGVPAPLLTILVCVNYDGTDNFFSAST
jgi:hypothetical protein